VTCQYPVHRGDTKYVRVKAGVNLNSRGYYPKIWVGVCGALFETLNLFQTKLHDFPYPISDLNQNSIPYFRPDQELFPFA